MKARIAIINDQDECLATEDVNIDEVLYAETDVIRAFRRAMTEAKGK